MKYITWAEVVEEITPHIVRVSTPEGSGTGFFVAKSDAGNIQAIATANHVLSHAHLWDLPIRIEHMASKTSLLLKAGDRAIFVDERLDTAAVAFDKGVLGLPEKPLDLAPEGKYLKIGNEIAWLGFPAIASQNLCFFSGRVSCYIDDSGAYLVDGVSINGVSGGPAIYNGDGKVVLMGVISGYLPNRAAGDALPGLSVVMNVNQFHYLVNTLGSLGEAMNRQVPPETHPSDQGGI